MLLNLLFALVSFFPSPEPLITCLYTNAQGQHICAELIEARCWKLGGIPSRCPLYPD